MLNHWEVGASEISYESLQSTITGICNLLVSNHRLPSPAKCKTNPSPPSKAVIIDCLSRAPSLTCVVSLIAAERSEAATLMSVVLCLWLLCRIRYPCQFQFCPVVVMCIGYVSMISNRGLRMTSLRCSYTVVARLCRSLAHRFEYTVVPRAHGRYPSIVDCH